jgi:hypothetical protein
MLAFHDPKARGMMARFFDKLGEPKPHLGGQLRAGAKDTLGNRGTAGLRALHDALAKRAKFCQAVVECVAH